MSAAIKAFSVHSDEWSEIAFAKHRVTALRAVAGECNDGEIGGLRTNRVAWADKYAPGPVPLQAKIEHGWWAECSGCYRRVSDDSDVDDDGFTCTPVYEGTNDVWCSAECKDHQRLERIERRAAETKALEALRAELAQKITGLSLTGSDHVYVVRDDDGVFQANHVRIGFRFPGCVIGDAHYRFQKADGPAYVAVCHGDQAAWQAWRATESTA